MATSGSVDFAITRDEIITEALELIGRLASGDTAAAADVTTCAMSLNLMIKSWMADGVKIWKVSEGELTLVASQAAYTLGVGGDLVIDKPIRIVEARRNKTSSDIDTPLTAISRDEYMRLSNKTLESIPTQFYFQPGLTTSTFTLWPAPGTTEASDYTVKISYYSLIEDFDAAADNPDFPIEWGEALAYNLAVRIAAKFGVPPGAIPGVIALAGELKETAQTWDQEKTSVFFGVDFGQM